MVDESEILSVDALRRVLNREAARDRFLVVVLPPVGVVLDASAPSAGDAVLGLAAAPVPLGDFPPSRSSSSVRACAAPSDRARLSLPLRPPLPLTGADPSAVPSSIVARSESSRDMRFSVCVWMLRGACEGADGLAAGLAEALELARATVEPWERGEGRTGRACWFECEWV